MKRLTSRRIAVLFAGFLMAAIIFPGIAMSQAEEEAIIFPWYTSLTVGRIQFEGDEELDPGFLMSLRLGYDLNERWTFESMAYLAPQLPANTKEFPDQDDSSLFGLAFDGLFHITRLKRFDPYLAAGIGFTHYGEKLEDGNQDDVTLRGGGGVMYHFNDEWAVRADFRGMLAGFGESPNANSMIDGGIIWTWGARVPTIIRATGESPDSDGDGLTDLEENDLGTDPYHPDTDRDRLKDGPEVHQYKTDPLNADSDWDLLKDGDEVLDYGTEPMIVDTDFGGVGDGHEVLEDRTDPKNGADDLVLYTLNIEFDTDKSVIKSEYFGQIDVIGKVLTRNPGSKAVIEGHADQRKRSAKAYNDRLSKQRATAVLNHLVTKCDVAKKRMKSEGYGFSRPLPNEVNDPVHGNRKNRRVEIYLSGIDDKTNLPKLPPVGDISPEDK